MQEKAQEESDGSTHFNFEHKVFSVEGCYFTADRNGDKPKFLMPMGDEMAAIALGSLRQEFGVADDSSDGHLLDIVAKSLKFVQEIRPKDSIPQEILDGTASWSVQDRHRHAAHARIKIQLATLMTGREDQVIDPDQIEMLADDPKIKKQVQKAFSLVAKKLGLKPEQKQEVINKIEQLGHELSFIEGLRERFASITEIQPKIERLIKFYGNQTTTREDLDRVKVLLGGAVEDIETIFDIVDAQTCEIMTVLRGFDLHIQHIRDARDDLHRRFMDWDDVIDPWQAEECRERSTAVEQMVKESYRLLAQRFASSQAWGLVGQS